MKTIVAKSNDSDSQLAANALAGQRDAFAQIVTRYQSLVCSLAYSATGSLSQSEDLAQETFIAAWKGLRTLREPEKLRSWLCGIARKRGLLRSPRLAWNRSGFRRYWPMALSLPVSRTQMPNWRLVP